MPTPSNFGIYNDKYDGGPSPSTFVANTATVILVEFIHSDGEISNQSLQTPLPQEEAMRVDTPQTLPEMESM